MLTTLFIFSTQEVTNIKIFDKCFSPQSVVVGNNQIFSFDLFLHPFQKMEKLNPTYVRNMCEVVFFNAMATVTLVFDVVGVPVQQTFQYIYNTNQTITFQLSQADYSHYSSAKFVHFTVAFPGQQPLSFGVQSLRFLKKDFANCYLNVSADYDIMNKPFIRMNVTTSSCDIDVTQMQVHFQSATLKLLIPPCAVECEPGQYGSTTSFVETTNYMVRREDLVTPAELEDFDKMVAIIE